MSCVRKYCKNIELLGLYEMEKWRKIFKKGVVRPLNADMETPILTIFKEKD